MYKSLGFIVWPIGMPVRNVFFFRSVLFSIFFIECLPAGTNQCDSMWNVCACDDNQTIDEQVDSSVGLCFKRMLVETPTRAKCVARTKLACVRSFFFFFSSSRFRVSRFLIQKAALAFHKMGARKQKQRPKST